MSEQNEVINNEHNEHNEHIEEFPDYNCNCEEITAELNAKNDALNDKLLRSLAEFDNFRKRSIKERADAYDLGLTNAIEAILPALDNFERALQTAADNDVIKGIMMIYKQLENSLKELGIEEIETLTFDPKLHNAVSHIENDRYEAQAIAEVLQKGYKYKNKIIRHSMVVVAN